MRSVLCLLPLFLTAACGGDHHPLAGNWAQELPGDAKGMNIEFDGKSSKLAVHTAPRADGGHEDVSGTYTWDAATKVVTVHAELAGPGKANTWTGKLDGEHLELSSPDGKLTFHHGGDAHGH